MAKFKVYLSSSMQEKNIGVAGYGTEEERMFFLADCVADLLVKNGSFIVYRNKKEWALEQLVNDVNSKCDKNDIFIDLHTNAGSGNAQGTECFYYGQGGVESESYRLAKTLYYKVAPIGIGVDRGIKPDTSVYKTGLYVIQKTNPVACLIESIFHTNVEEVKDYLSKIDIFAFAIYEAICEYTGVWYARYNETLESVKKERDRLQAVLDKIEALVEQIKSLN